MVGSILSSEKLVVLKEALLYLHVKELKVISLNLGIKPTSKKIELILAILYFLETGKYKEVSEVPAVSLAKKGVVYKLSPNQVMLKGAYKNDLATRNFFKHLIGKYFHFTAFGIDWVNEQWMAGSPPTYQQFAEMWMSEYARRQVEEVAPKEEWALINFVKSFLQSFPQAPQEIVMQAWRQERVRQSKIVNDILAQVKA